MSEVAEDESSSLDRLHAVIASERMIRNSGPVPPPPSLLLDHLFLRALRPLLHLHLPVQQQRSYSHTTLMKSEIREMYRSSSQTSKLHEWSVHGMRFVYERLNAVLRARWKDGEAKGADSPVSLLLFGNVARDDDILNSVRDMPFYKPGPSSSASSNLAMRSLEP
eukprot:ANDGO_07669.mRNA.1 hypothetical protein